jgi:hypothetical protein
MFFVLGKTPEVLQLLAQEELQTILIRLMEQFLLPVEYLTDY